MQIVFVANIAGGAAQVTVNADNISDFQAAMLYLDESGLVRRNAEVGASAAPAVEVGQQTEAGQAALEDGGKPKGKRKAAEAKTEPEVKGAAPEKEAEPVKDEPNPPTQEDVAAAVTAYNKALQDAGKSEQEAIAAIKTNVYAEFGIKRASELAEDKRAEMIAVLRELTAKTEAAAL